MAIFSPLHMLSLSVWSIYHVHSSTAGNPFVWVRMCVYHLPECFCFDVPKYSGIRKTIDITAYYRHYLLWMLSITSACARHLNNHQTPANWCSRLKQFAIEWVQTVQQLKTKPSSTSKSICLQKTGLCLIEVQQCMETENSPHHSNKTKNHGIFPLIQWGPFTQPGWQTQIQNSVYKVTKE